MEEEFLVGNFHILYAVWEDDPDMVIEAYVNDELRGLYCDVYDNPVLIGENHVVQFLDFLWESFNSSDFTNNLGLRSMSVGDIIVFAPEAGEEQAFKVASKGFTEVVFPRVEAT